MKKFFVLLFLLFAFCGFKQAFIQKTAEAPLICGKWEEVHYQRNDLSDSAFYKNLKTMVTSTESRYLVLNKNGSFRNEVLGYGLKKGTWKVSTNEREDKRLEIFGKGKVATRDSFAYSICYLSADCLVLRYQSKGPQYHVFRKVK